MSDAAISGAYFKRKNVNDAETPSLETSNTFYNYFFRKHISKIIILIVSMPETEKRLYGKFENEILRISSG